MVGSRGIGIEYILGGLETSFKINDTDIKIIRNISI